MNWNQFGILVTAGITLLAVALHYGVITSIKDCFINIELNSSLGNITIGSYNLSEFNPDHIYNYNIACFANATKLDEYSECLRKLDITMQKINTTYHHLIEEFACFERSTNDTQLINCAGVIDNRPTANAVCGIIVSRHLDINCISSPNKTYIRLFEEDNIALEACYIREIQSALESCKTMSMFTINDDFIKVFRGALILLGDPQIHSCLTPILQSLSCMTCDSVPIGVLREDCLELCHKVIF